MMSRDEWRVGFRHRKVLADAWGVADATVRGYSAVAHKMVALDPDMRAQLRDELAARMDEIAERARATRNAMTGMPDFRAEIEAVKLRGEYLGVRVEEDDSAKPTTQPVRIEVVLPGKATKDEPEADPSRE
jgi:hypothetical protein